MVPSAFSLDPMGQFVFAAGSASGRPVSYHIQGETGAAPPRVPEGCTSSARRMLPSSSKSCERLP